MDDDRLTPAEFLRREIESRGLSQGDLAFALGIPPAAVSQIVAGRRGLTAEMACSLAAVFGMQPEYILGLQKAAELRSELSRVRGPSELVAKNAQLIATYPVREMVKRGWLVDDRLSLDAQLAAFFGVDDVAEVPHLEHAGKKASYADVPPAQLAWLFRAKHIARGMVVPPYAAKTL